MCMLITRHGFSFPFFLHETTPHRSWPKFSKYRRLCFRFGEIFFVKGEHHGVGNDSAGSIISQSLTQSINDIAESERASSMTVLNRFANNTTFTLIYFALPWPRTCHWVWTPQSCVTFQFGSVVFSSLTLRSSKFDSILSSQFDSVLSSQFDSVLSSQFDSILSSQFDSVLSSQFDSVESSQ
jgi:hypothetical protein